MAKSKRPDKGRFGRISLPLAKAYLFPSGRNGLLRVGLMLALVVGAAVVASMVLENETLISSGPLSGNHASFADDCASCHTPFGPVGQEKCSDCHERYGDALGVYAMDAHYVYRSGDMDRSSGGTRRLRIAGVRAHPAGQRED